MMAKSKAQTWLVLVAQCCVLTACATNETTVDSPLDVSGCEDADCDVLQSDTGLVADVCMGEGCDVVDPCAACESGTICQDGLCVPDPCLLSCEDLGYVCGEHCGQSCGSCQGELELCEDYVCVCYPDCRDKACGDDDGCGQPCEPCASDMGCPDCPLRLSVIDDGGGTGGVVTIALDYLPEPSMEQPREAEILLSVQGEFEIIDVVTGQAVRDANKDLASDPTSGKPWFQPSPDRLRFVILSASSVETIGAGRWFELRLRPGRPFEPQKMPLAIAVVDRDGIFAPPPADQSLWGFTLDVPVVIWPQ